MESTNQEEVHAEKDTIASSVKEKTADPILSEKNIKYEGKLNRAKDGINTKPYGTEGYKTIRLVNDWVGKKIRVTKEAITPRATWAYVQVVGTNVSGWIDKKGLEIDTITFQKDVLYDAKLLRAADGINSKPYGTEGYETNRLVGDLVGQQVRVTKEALTPRATWAYIEVPETDISGWIDIKGVKLVETILSEKNVKYEGKLTRKNDGINTKPYGVAGYKTDRLVGNLVGKRVTITKEAVTPRATWVYIKVSGTKISGWVDKKGIAIDTITSQKDVLYDAKLLRAADGINSKPYGTEGYKTNRLVGDLVGQQVRVTKEAVTPRATWAYIEVPETDISGWIDIKGIKLVETILSEKNVKYEGKLTRKNDGINTKPYGVAGYKTDRLVGNLVGKRVTITKEAVTPRATWAYVQVKGTNISGWVDKAGIQEEKILSQKNVNYSTTLKRSTDGINSKPYGVEGYKTIRLVNDWVGKEVHVTKEAITPRATWAYIEVVGTGVSGWIDKKGLKTTRTVYLDPGHGGSDSGATYSGVYEKNLNLAVSLKVRTLLEKKGYNVVMSRTNDKTVGLYDRPAKANKIGADIFVSIHHNAMPGNSTVTGIETYHYKYSSSYPPRKENLPYHNDTKRLNNSLKLSNSIHGELINNTGANNRKVKGSAFVVVRETQMPAVLLELGYMTSPSELKKLQTNSYQDKMAKAIFNGIDSYFK